MLQQTSKRITWSYRFALFQGFFYLATGLWALLDIESFMWVTGPKTDVWLVKTVGFLITATGIVLLLAVRKKELTASLVWLAILNAGFLAAIDIYYALSDVISNIYLADAAVEILIVIVWFFLFPQKRVQ